MTEMIRDAKQIAGKKYVVKLSDTERERLNTFDPSGKHPARQLTKARILLKADGRRPARDGVTAGSRGSGYQHRHGCSDPPTTGGGGVRVRADPQAFAGLGQTADL